MIRPAWRRAMLAGVGMLAAIAGREAAIAQAPAAPVAVSAAALAGNCANCHGTHGRSIGTMPSLAGADRAYLVEQMRRFRDGTRPATIMHQLAKGYTDDETERIADFFARQPRDRTTGQP